MKSLPYLFSLLFCLLLSVAVHAQKSKLSTDNKKAIEAYNKGVNLTNQRLYKQALEEFESALKKDKKFAEAYLKQGNVFRAIGERAKARESYQKGFELLQNDTGFGNEHFYFADYLMTSGDLAGADKHLKAFLQSKNPNQKLMKQVELMQQSLAFIPEAMKNPVDFKPVRMSQTINRFHHQYFPAVTADEQYFLYTARSAHEADEEIYVSTKTSQGNWGEPKIVSGLISSPGNEGAANISGDGKTLVFTACDRKDSYGSCDLYVSYRQGDKWSAPKNLGSAVNSTSWDSQPSLSADGRTLYFSSRRAGGLGKVDIWVTKRNEKGAWEKPINLGAPINTPEEETSPCLHASGSTLYFASEGHPGMGGADLFRADWNGTGWDKPKNLGYPLNTFYNETTIYIDAANKKGYFSKDMGGSSSSKIELYEFEVPKELKSKLETVYSKGRVYDADTKKPIGATVEVFNLNTGELTASVTSDSISGEYVVVLNEGNQYGMYATANNYLPNNQNFDYTNKKDFNPKSLDIYLSPAKKGAAIVLQNLFFETNKYELEEKSKTELDQVIRFLKENPKVSVEISGHTDDRGTDANNMTLSNNRAKSVQQYLIKEGIQADRIKAKGYGKQKPAAGNDTEENRAKNRRIELRIL